MDITKLIGWLVFLAGILIIGFTLYSSYDIFTGKQPAPEFFKPSETQVSQTQATGLPTDLDQIQQMVGEQLKGFLPLDSITQFLNLGVWGILTGILIFGGAKISELGIRLIKK
ncbi:unnamed protein product [marine sediment metagenome]|uniref:Uncharacterized protein n=1 Tax=marine sediment metagenome TaxID=412755 RepID=X1MFB4_9ZZZZ